jgi:hypothetical protein
LRVAVSALTVENQQRRGGGHPTCARAAQAGADAAGRAVGFAGGRAAPRGGVAHAGAGRALPGRGAGDADAKVFGGLGRGGGREGWSLGWLWFLGLNQAMDLAGAGGLGKVHAAGPDRGSFND